MPAISLSNLPTCQSVLSDTKNIFTSPQNRAGMSVDMQGPYSHSDKHRHTVHTHARAHTPPRHARVSNTPSSATSSQLALLPHDPGFSVTLPFLSSTKPFACGRCTSPNGAIGHLVPSWQNDQHLKGRKQQDIHKKRCPLLKTDPSDTNGPPYCKGSMSVVSNCTTACCARGSMNIALMFHGCFLI